MDRSQLVAKHIVDKRGRHTTKWIKLDQPKLDKYAPKHDQETRKEIVDRIARQKHTSKVSPLFQAFGLAVIDNSRYGKFEMTLVDIATGKPIFVETGFFDKFVEKGLRHIEDNKLQLRNSDFDMDAPKLLGLIKELEKDGMMSYSGMRDYIVNHLLRSNHPLTADDLTFDVAYDDLFHIPEKKRELYKQEVNRILESKNFKRGVEVFSSIVNKSILHGQPLEIEVSFPELLYQFTNGEQGEKRTRAFARRDDMISISTFEDPATIAHELAHCLDFRPSLHNKVYNYYRSRTKDDKEVPLGKSYRKDEVTREDKWKSRYTGKVYGAGVTEVMSMWFTEVLRDPIEFAKLDPDHFTFGFELLKGLR